MSDLSRTFQKNNLIRAWKWLNTNPSYQYKNFFRDTYSAYATNFEGNIVELMGKLTSRVYMPTKPSILLQPKTSCTTRKITLLSIEDQIVYQALINIVAEKVNSKFKKRYLKTTFGNLYAGKNRTFFYRKWDNCFKEYNKTIKKTYKSGYNFIASFDLTACYDTIDHKVLAFRLEQLGLEKEFVNFLLDLLCKWSSNTEIYKSHGIPQGPMSSGFLAEIILSHFDEKWEKIMKKDVFYFRYVDDIKILGKSEGTLTKMLAELDYYSKQIGLFPQSSKIEVKEIENINEEINNISPIQHQILASKVTKNNKEIEKELFSTIKNGKVIDKTKFKMLLANVNHDAKISRKLLNTLLHNPQYFYNIGRYFENYPRKISDGIIKLLLEQLNKEESYQITNATLIDSIVNNISKKNNDAIKYYVMSKWNNRDKEKLNPYFRYIVVKYLLINNCFNFKKLHDFLTNEKDWWVKKSILKYIDINTYGTPSYLSIMRECLDNENPDISLSATKEILENDLAINSPYTSINYLAQKTLKFAGIINRSSSRPSTIGHCFSFICSKKIPVFNWKKVFGKNHKDAEIKMIRAYTYVQNDMSAFINILDTFNDILIDKLFDHDKSIGSYTLGKPGSILSSTGSRFENKYPNFFKMCKTIHDKRLECDLSHPVIKKTKKYTKPIEYKYIFSVRNIIYNGICELISKW